MIRAYVIGAIGPKKGRAARCERAIEVGRLLFAAGFAVNMQQFLTAMRPEIDGTLSRDFVLAADAAWLDVSNVAVWDRGRCPDASEGGDKEVARAKTRGIPVIYSVEEAIAWRDNPVPYALAALRVAEAAFKAGTVPPEHVGDVRAALRRAQRVARGERVE